MSTCPLFHAWRFKSRPARIVVLTNPILPRQLALRGASGPMRHPSISIRFTDIPPMSTKSHLECSFTAVAHSKLPTGVIGEHSTLDCVPSLYRLRRSRRALRFLLPILRRRRGLAMRQTPFDSC